MPNEEGYTFINIRLDQEQVKELDALVAEDTKLIGLNMDRSKTVKRLIPQEFERRQHTGLIVAELPAPEGAQAPILVGVRSNGDCAEVE